MRLPLMGLVLLALCLGGTIFNPAPSASAQFGAGAVRQLAIGDVAPNWTLIDPKGKTHSLSDYRGKVVVLDFWATWCSKCAKLMPVLEKVHQKYKNKGVVVLGVNAWETGDPVSVMHQKGMTYKVLLKGEEMAPAYGVGSVPAIYVIGVDGKVIYFQAGAEEKGLPDVIEKYLQARKSE